MLIAAALLVGGSIVYAFVPTNAGALMIAAGGAMAVVSWIDKIMRQLQPAEKGTRN